jgi:hypothetical protein
MVEVSGDGRRQKAGFGRPCMNDQPGNAQDIRHRAPGGEVLSGDGVYRIH